jgi:hypothetical protein
VIFSPEQLTKIVNETLPKDQTASHVVVGSIDQNGVQVVASFKKDATSKWELQAAARHDWSGSNEVGAKVILQW